MHFELGNQKVSNKFSDVEEVIDGFGIRHLSPMNAENTSVFFTGGLFVRENSEKQRKWHRIGDVTVEVETQPILDGIEVKEEDVTVRPDWALIDDVVEQLKY